MGCYYHTCIQRFPTTSQLRCDMAAPRFIHTNKSSKSCGTDKNNQIMKTIHLICFITCSISILTGCAPLKTPVIVKNAPIEKYKYIYVSPTRELTSGTGSGFGIYSASITQSVNPRDVISEILINEGFTLLPELKPELTNETLIVNYGEGKRRKRGLGSTLEITLQFLSAQSYEVLCTCTAEGQGSTEADDIRMAIRRALSGLFSNK